MKKLKALMIGLALALALAVTPAWADDAGGADHSHPETAAEAATPTKSGCSTFTEDKIPGGIFFVTLGLVLVFAGRMRSKRQL